MAAGMTFLLAVLGRAALALVNRQSNDDHLEVIHFLRSGKPINSYLECWECFQPKLFHRLCSGVLDLLGIVGTDNEIVVCQFINVFSGMVMLLFVYKTLRLFNFSNVTVLLSFALVALNPKLASTNCMVTNDSFVILFGTLTVYFLVRFVLWGHWVNSLLCSLFVVLACLTKGNGLMFLVALPLMVAKMIHVKNVRFRNLLVAAYFVVPLAIFFIGPYSMHYRQAGNALVTNRSACALPPVFEKDECGRPGVRSIREAYFSFPLIALIQQPYTTTGREDYPPHRTSFWGQLYGQTWSVHFDRFPFSWVSENPRILWLTRVELFLGLLPLSLLLVGLFRLRNSLALPVIANIAGTSMVTLRCSILLLVLSAFAFDMVYALRFRDYSCMKIIFVFPALSALSVAFAAGLEKFIKFRAVPVILGLLLLSGALEFAYLVRNLWLMS